MANDVIIDMSNSNLSSEVVKTKVIIKNEPSYTQSITIYIDEVSWIFSLLIVGCYGYTFKTTYLTLLLYI